ncbi:MAG: hemerythrin domain-containing protein [Dethiosulfatibacter sp.]|nr:hemerythrin domain-containing protein [Dethiosulfatibacter sp.]
MTVLDHIKEEHESFREKIAKIEATTSNKKMEIFNELFAEIHGHHEAEEKVIFPLVIDKKDEKTMDIVLEMIEEHTLVSYHFSVLEKESVDNETWDAKFSLLKEKLNHHLEEEEEEFLPMARKMISEEKLIEMLDKFETVNEDKTKEKKKKLERGINV